MRLRYGDRADSVELFITGCNLSEPAMKIIRYDEEIDVGEVFTWIEIRSCSC